jgi:hypothetical protein
MTPHWDHLSLGECEARERRDFNRQRHRIEIG